MGKAVTVGVNTHGHCFDGLASAVIFTQLLRDLRPQDDLAFTYRSCGYGPKMSSIPADWLRSDINAILDFRYTESERLSFYFDHHATGFESPHEQARAREEVARSGRDPNHPGRRLFYDATYGSCTKLIHDVAAKDFGVSLSALGDLVEWADRIDAARFDSAEAALGDSPAQRIAQVIEQHGDATFLTEMVERLGSQSLGEVADSAPIRALYAPIEEAKNDFRDRVKRAAVVMDDVVLVDLSDDVVSAGGKFLTYAMFPTKAYSVTVLRTKQLIKVGVGYNPWCGRPRRHDISLLCKREGGGGHPVVGAAAFPLEARDKAREAAARICKALEA